MVFSQLLANSIISGSIISLVASGFSLIYSTNRFAHFAHGAVVAAGGDPVAAATAALNSNVASNMFAGGQAIGAVTTAFSMLGFALFGFAIWQAKNFNPIVACLMVVAGIFTLLMCLIDYENPLVAIGYIGVVVSFVCLGVGLLNQKD